MRHVNEKAKRLIELAGESAIYADIKSIRFDADLCAFLIPTKYSDGNGFETAAMDALRRHAYSEGRKEGKAEMAAEIRKALGL